LLQSLAVKMLNWLKPASGLRENGNVLRGYVWVVAAVLFFGFVLWRGIPMDQKGTGNVYLPDKMPVQAADWLKQNPQTGNMFNQFAWGGYILYRLWPAEKVFIDGQTDFYGEALLREYFEVTNVGVGWEAILDKYAVSWMLIPRNDEFAEYLYFVDDDVWDVIYEDDTAVIFRRDDDIAVP